MIIDQRKLIAKNYMKGWFTIDLVSIFPFEYMMVNASGSNDLNGMAKVARIGRMYKLVKLTRLFRVLKIYKAKNNFF